MKLLFVDLDETLLNTDKTISKINLDAIDRMCRLGHGFVINTGRPLASAIKIAKEYAFDKEGYYISSFNGSLIVKADTLEPVYKCGVDKEIARLVFDEAKKASIHVHTYCGDCVISERETDMLIDYAHTINVEYKIVDDAIGYTDGYIPKIICADLYDHEMLVEFQKYIEPKIAGKMYSLFSNPKLLEFGSTKASKGIAIKVLSDIMGVDMADTFGVGDEENDIEMIKMAGTGFAMKNAKDSVKEVCDVITEYDNNNGGVAWIIDNYILN